MTLNQFKILFCDKLAHIYEQNEIYNLLQILCEDLLSWSKSHYLINDRQELLHIEQLVLEKSLAQLILKKPIQHITGKAHFYGEIFTVNEHTLIPRQETEELVDWIIKENKDKEVCNILDIGTGSGCIAITLSKNIKQSQITAIDISQKAIEIAQQNASQLNGAITTQLQDILALEHLPIHYDVIVSNPPYVRELEKVEIHDNVLDYEPHTALFVPDQDPLLFYRQILKLAKAQNATVYFEINQYLGKEMMDLASEMGYSAVIKKDLNGNDRMMRCDSLNV